MRQADTARIPGPPSQRGGVPALRYDFVQNSALAQEVATIPDHGPWTLERALQRAMEANPDLQIAKHTVEREAGVRLQVQAALLPHVRAVASVDERDSSLIDRSPREFEVAPSERTAVARYGYDLRLEVRQLVFDGLGGWNQLRRQKLLQQQAYLAFRNTANRVASLVRQGYDAVLLHQQIVGAEAKRIEELQQLAEYTRRKQMVGEIAEFELLRAETELQAARAEFAEAERRLTEAEQRFRSMLQLEDSGERLVLEGELAQREFAMPYGHALAQALENRPDLEAAMAAVEASKAHQRALLSEYLPKVEAYAAYGVRSSYYNSGTELEGWTIGAVGQWNIFDGLETRGRQRAQLAERRIAETRLEAIENQISSQLRELYQGLAQSRQVVEAQKQSLELASRALRQATRLYEAGQASLEQVLQAETSRRRAQNSFSESIFSFNTTVAQIEFAVGGQLVDSVATPDAWTP